MSILNGGEKYQKEINYLVNDLGFQPDEIQVRGEQIVLQEDMVFDGPTFWDHFKKSPEAVVSELADSRTHRQWVPAINVSNFPRTITLNVLPSAASYAPVVQLAANVWNSRNSKIRFICLSASTETMLSGAINIKAESFGSANNNVMAETNMPQNGNPATLIRFNTTGPNLTTSQKLKTTVHEIGHAVSLDHTDGTTGTYIPTTCGYTADVNSVMRQGIMSWTNFTNCDKEAIKFLYAELPVSGGIYKLTHKGTNQCLDVASNSSTPGANVQQWTDNGNNAQRWVVTLESDGFYKLTHVDTNQCLDVANNSSTPGANVQQWTDNGNNAQRWKIEPMPDGSYKLTHKGTNQCLDVANNSSAPGANVQQWTDNGNNAQRWILTKY